MNQYFHQYYNLSMAFSPPAWSSLIKYLNNHFVQKKHPRTHFEWKVWAMLNFFMGDNFCPFCDIIVPITKNELATIFSYVGLPESSTQKYLVGLTFLSFYRTLFISYLCSSWSFSFWHFFFFPHRQVNWKIISGDTAEKHSVPYLLCYCLKLLSFISKMGFKMRTY